MNENTAFICHLSEVFGLMIFFSLSLWNIHYFLGKLKREWNVYAQGNVAFLLCLSFTTGNNFSFNPPLLKTEGIEMNKTESDSGINKWKLIWVWVQHRLKGKTPDSVCSFSTISINSLSIIGGCELREVHIMLYIVLIHNTEPMRLNYVYVIFKGAVCNFVDFLNAFPMPA